MILFAPINNCLNKHNQLMQHIFLATLPIFLIALIGSIAKRNWLDSEEFWRGLEKLSYYLLFPSVLFNSITNVNLNSVSVIKLATGLTISTLIIAIVLMLHQRILKTTPKVFTSIFQGAIRYNSYIFLGLSRALFGDEGLTIVAIISAYMIILTNILSVTIFAIYLPENNKYSNKKDMSVLLSLIATNPLILASILGFIFNYFELTLNLGIKKTISSFSDAALAIGMLNIGAGLKLAIDVDHFKQIFYCSFVKLILFPIVTMIILSSMSITGLEKSIGILYSCLPCASSAYVLSRQLNGDSDSMVAIITFTTIFSLVSLSILIYILI